MNKTLLWIIIAIIVIGGAAILLNNRSQSGSTQNSNQTVTQAPSTESPTVATTNPSGPTQTEGQTVTVTAGGFNPSTITIKAGTKVTWINKSGAVISINSNPHPIHTDYSPLNLGTVQDGASVSLTFDKPGTYGYHNHLNPSQTGTIVVQ